MESILSTIALWSYGFAAISYLALTPYLLRWQVNRRDRATTAIVIAVAASSIWALCGFLLSISNEIGFALLQNVFDCLRYGAWHAFVILLP